MKWISRLIGIIFLIISMFLFSSYKKEDKKIEEIKEELDVKKVEESFFLKIDFSKLKEQNKDVVGWIQIEGTEIDYPIVKAYDNQYYLTHNFKQEKSKAGWIFQDYRTSFNKTKENIILYGHGRLDNTMFGRLRSFLKEEWWKEKKNEIKLATFTDTRIYKIVSVYTILPETYYLKTFFESKEKWIEYQEKILKRSLFPFEETLNASDELLTLSTCQNGNQKRIVVHAKLIKKEIH